MPDEVLKCARNPAARQKVNVRSLFLVQCSVGFEHNWEDGMMSGKVETWVVYLMAVKNTNGMRAVCEQMEWDAMEQANPGLHHLIQGGIASESEAELLARGVSGDPKPRRSKGR
jgi:hypothetical protein